MELWDLYTEYRENTGKEQVRGDAIPEGCYHLVVHVWIRNSKGEYLISLRSADRPIFPLMWECVGGSVLKGESSRDGAIREVKEEVGIDLLPDNGSVIFSDLRRDSILDVWQFDYDGELQLANATTNEVKECRWMTMEEIRILYKEKKLVHTLGYFLNDFSELKPFLNDAMQLTALPAKYKKKLKAYYYLAAKLTAAKKYTEAELNDSLNRHALFDDPATLRREMYNRHLLERTKDGEYYWRTKELPLLNDFIAQYV